MTTSTDMHLRSFTAELELRRTGDGRTIFGIAVPYGRSMFIPQLGMDEQFDRGVFANQLRAPYRVPFAMGHLPEGGRLIGATKLLRDDAAGMYGEWSVAKTPAGDEALALFESGALTDLSVGFLEGRNRAMPRGVARQSATLKEVGLVPEGAYGQLAMAMGVRSAASAGPVEPPALATPNLDEARKMLASLPPRS